MSDYEVHPIGTAKRLADRASAPTAGGPHHNTDTQALERITQP